LGAYTASRSETGLLISSDYNATELHLSELRQSITLFTPSSSHSLKHSVRVPQPATHLFQR
jgi:hypothetical protein